MTTSQSPASSATTNLVRLAVIIALSVFFALALKLTWHWPFVGDAQVFHYVVFLMQHGFVPYRQIFDINMPGAYLVEVWALALFGPSDLGWRLYDLFLAALMAAGMLAIARRTDWVAGLAAAALFTLVHFADGPQAAGQRDQIIAVLLVLSCACLFAAVHRHVPWLTFPFAFAAMMAASIKPTMLFAGLVPLILACVHLKREAVPLKRYWLYAIAGSIFATGIVVAFLIKAHAIADFLHLLTQVVPLYGGQQRLSLATMLLRSLPLPVAVFVLLGVLAGALRKGRQSWEEISLLVFAAIGAFSFLAQGKGFPQHRYTLLAFLLLWVCLQLSQAIHDSSLVSCVAIAAILCALFYVAPREIARIRLYPQHDGYTAALEQDLHQLGTAPLQHKIQCLDIIDGCLTALYHLQIVQTTGHTGDLGFFLPGHSAAVDARRAMFWPVLQQNPPTVFILSNAQFGVSPRSFDGKLATWPQFSALLQADYILVQQRAFRNADPVPTTLGQDTADVAYRIYLRRDSPHPQTSRE